MYGHQGNICGRCPIDFISGGIRNTGLEAIIKLLTVPCMHRRNGCSAILNYNENDNNIRKHELDCSYRNFNCPSIPVHKCNWNGKRIDIQHHYREKHHNYIYTAGNLLDIDLSYNMAKNIMVDSMYKIFFMHINYEKISRTIYCGLISLDQPSDNKVYEFTIELTVGTKLFATKSRNCRMAENFVLDTKDLCEIKLDKIQILVNNNTKFLKYSLSVNEVDKSS